MVVHQSAKHSLVQLRRGHALREVPRDDLGHERDETPKRILLVEPGENQKRGLEVHALHVARLGVVRGVRGEDVPERPPSGLTRPELEALLGERRARAGQVLLDLRRCLGNLARQLQQRVVVVRNADVTRDFDPRVSP